MNIGILSLTSGYNFGGTLQTIALSRAIESFGHHVTVLDYWPTPPRNIPFWRGWGLMSSNRSANARKRIAEIRHLRLFQEKYDDFKLSELKWSKRCFDKSSLEEVVSDLDAVVVGSDQVWNLKYHPDPNYYLADFPDFHGRRIAYAACCGNPNQQCPEYAAEALKKFDSIGVRNAFTADWVRRCAGDTVNPVVVCDPTLLFEEYPNKSMNLPDSYIAVYLIGNDDGVNHKRIIEQLRKKYGHLPVLCLMPTGFAIWIRDWCDEVMWYLDPYEWIQAINSATVVYTDSFHAVLFALRNCVPFIATYTEEVRAPRLLDLKTRYNLNGCIQKASMVEITYNDIDWGKISEAWQNDRTQSNEILKFFVTLCQR